MKLSNKIPYLKEIGIGAGAGALVLILIIAGFSLSGGGNLPTANPTNSSSASNSATATASPSGNRTCSVATQATDPLLATLHAVVMNASTDEVLFDRLADVPAATASTMKTLTAAAAVLTLGPTYRVETRVYSDPAQPGTIFLVGGGDPTLSRTAPGVQSVYKDAPKLSNLAVQVNAWANGSPITRIVLDSSKFAGPSWESSWERSEQTEGYMPEITALTTDGDRAKPGNQDSPRSTKPVTRAGAAFKAAIGSLATSATVEQGTLPAGAVQIAKVASQPISKWINHMMQVSDNTEAEYLARLVSLKLGYDGSFSSLNAAIKQALSTLALDMNGLTIRDGSGLSDFNAVSPKFMAQLFKLIVNDSNGLETVHQSLTVAGESGSLASRFGGENKDAAGHIFAKTGWIKKGYTLAGIIKAEDGTDLVFAVYALGEVQEATKQAIDNLVTGFYRCGNTLSNN